MGTGLYFEDKSPMDELLCIFALFWECEFLAFSHTMPLTHYFSIEMKGSIRDSMSIAVTVGI